ncbi:hypothetical protein [Streptomyces sp. E-08]|uniref:hypothetical protein n=1 Tax=Streptomyces sp. E-08 TaxID=3404047 RepID=UPI003CF6D74D
MTSSPQDSGNSSGRAVPPQDPPGTSAGEASDSSRRSNGRLGEWAALISAVAAVAGVALGFLGLPALVKSPTARPNTVYVTVTPTPTPTVAATTPTPVTSSSLPAPSSSPPAVNGTAITLSTDYGFRLRGPAPTVERYVRTLDFYRDYDELWAISGSRIVALKPEEPGTLATCKSVTRFVGMIDIATLEAGNRFCFESGKGGLALVEAPQNGDPDDFLELTIQFLGTR